MNFLNNFGRAVMAILIVVVLLLAVGLGIAALLGMGRLIMWLAAW